MTCSGKSTGGVSPQSSSGSIGSRRAGLVARYDGLLKYQANSSSTVSSSSQVDEDELDSPPSAPAGMYCLFGLNPWVYCPVPPVALHLWLSLPLIVDDHWKVHVHHTLPGIRYHPLECVTQQCHQETPRMVGLALVYAQSFLPQ